MTRRNHGKKDDRGDDNDDKKTNSVQTMIMTTIMTIESLHIDGRERSLGSLKILPW